MQNMNIILDISCHLNEIHVDIFKISIQFPNLSSSETKRDNFSITYKIAEMNKELRTPINF